MRAVWLLVLIYLPGCGRTPAPSGRQPEAGTTASAVIGTQAPAPSAGARGAPRCAVEEAPRTISDDEGRASEHGFVALENLRLFAREGNFLVTWERQSHFEIGDSWRAPHAALRRGAAAFRVVEFPVDAYACASYGSIAPASSAEIVTWGVANVRGFEFWPELPRTKKNESGEDVVVPGSARRLFTRRKEVNTFVISRRVALAATLDGECDMSCACSDTWKPALWVYGLDPKARLAARLAVASTTAPPALDNDVPNAPALAIGEHAGAAAFSSGRALYLSWLDGNGKPQGSPLRFDEGEVGAPALALAGRELIVVWARRDAKAEPYRLRWLRLAPLATPGAARTLSTPGSAFAPAVIADERSMVLAWMDGDADRRGAIYVARAELDDPRLEARQVSTPGETNARDPELSGSVEEPALVYAAFSKTRPGGEVRFGRLRCSAR